MRVRFWCNDELFQKINHSIQEMNKVIPDLRFDSPATMKSQVWINVVRCDVSPRVDTIFKYDKYCNYHVEISDEFKQ